MFWNKKKYDVYYNVVNNDFSFDGSWDAEKICSCTTKSEAQAIINRLNSVKLNHITPKLTIPLLSAVMLSRSRWFVGSSRRTTFPPSSIIFAIIHLTFSPPERTFASFRASSPEKSILPSQLRMYVSVWSFEKRRSQSTSERSQPSKKERLSCGR